MLKKFGVAAMIFCLSLIIGNLKTEAAEFELVSYSAQVKLQWLATTGDPDAQRILKELDKTNIFSHKNLRDYERLEKLNAAYQEICYETTVDYVRKNNYKNILDIGGGYSPRALVFAKEGRKYFGAELAAVAVSASGVMQKILDKKSFDNVDYDEVLVEDHDAMMAAADNFDGELCMVEQGLMIYLDQDRLADMYENLRDILKKHGGCFITSDLESRTLFKELSAVMYGEDQVQHLYLATKDMYEELFENNLNEENFDNQLDAVEYAEQDLGLKIQKVPLLTDISKLNFAKNMTPEQIEQLKKICAKNYLWVFTVE